VQEVRARPFPHNIREWRMSFLDSDNDGDVSGTRLPIQESRISWLKILEKKNLIFIFNFQKSEVNLTM
jgi:hypothetical protein